MGIGAILSSLLRISCLRSNSFNNLVSPAHAFIYIKAFIILTLGLNIQSKFCCALHQTRFSTPIFAIIYNHFDVTCLKIVYKIEPTTKFRLHTSITKNFE
jgi:hypothetical protein